MMNKRFSTKIITQNIQLFDTTAPSQAEIKIQIELLSTSFSLVVTKNYPYSIRGRDVQ